ncbi:uncharacterized protein V1516DRAFT_676571 [Lipomyces oligophaga]|uniref:uncharacterized protein n=1 Tax=Lipomyces oligophaga TaxID=45792 RepID=UPI0034CE7934
MHYLHTFIWTRNPEANKVYVTGSFDQWSKSLCLTKQSDNTWAGSVPVPAERTLYKFVVDDKWVIDPTARSEYDGNGAQNNVLEEYEISGQVFPNTTDVAESSAPLTEPSTASTVSDSKDLIQPVTAKTSTSQNGSSSSPPASLTRDDVDGATASIQGGSEDTDPFEHNVSPSDDTSDSKPSPAEDRTESQRTTSNDIEASKIEMADKKISTEEALNAFSAAPGPAIPTNMPPVQDKSESAQPSTPGSEPTFHILPIETPSIKPAAASEGMGAFFTTPGPVMPNTPSMMQAFEKKEAPVASKQEDSSNVSSSTITNSESEANTFTKSAGESGSKKSLSFTDRLRKLFK